MTTYIPDHIEPDPRTIDITRTMANLFGCHDDETIIEQLCDLADLAANARHDIRRDDLDALAVTVDIDYGRLITDFVEWTYPQ